MSGWRCGIPFEMNCLVVDREVQLGQVRVV